MAILDFHWCTRVTHYIFALEIFLMLPLHSLTQKMWTMTYGMPHFVCYGRSYDFYRCGGGHLEFLLMHKGYTLHLCSKDFSNATIAFLDPENVENDVLHATFCMLYAKLWILLLRRRPSWIFAHKIFGRRITEFGDFGEVTTCIKLSYDAKISF